MGLRLMALVLGLTLGVLSCSGGGSGGSSSLVVVDAVVEDLGELPLEGLYLNSEIVVQFSVPLDPASVSTQTFRVLEGPSFTQLAPGTIEVEESTVRFRPQLPLEADRSDSGFRPDVEYQLFLRGRPDLNTIRSRTGQPLAQTRTFTFTTRFEEPFFFDSIPGPPRVSAIFLDLNGNERFDADGDPATPEDEEFFDTDSVFDRFDPFELGVRTGSAGLPAPDAPLEVGFLFAEALDPATIFPDDDVDGQPDAFSLVDLTNVYACDDPRPGDLCPSPVLYDLTFEEFPPAPGESFARSLVRLRAGFGLEVLSRHRMVATSDLTDLNGNRLSATFNAVFETSNERPSEDVFFEDFSTTRRRGSATTGLWNPMLQTSLKGGVGFGGDGSDGPFLGSVIDTRVNDGIFNFSAWESTFNVEVRGPNPAIIRLYGDFIPLSLGQMIEASGDEGFQGQPDSLDPTPGGRGGPGGYDGGRGGVVDGMDVGEEGGAPPGTDGQGLGGVSGAGPGGGGGAGHRTLGQRGSNGDDSAGGDGGQRYGEADGTDFLGGGGGAGGGSDIMDDVDTGIAGGGSGGGGGGLLVFETFGRIQIRSGLPQIVIRANGGVGGRGSDPPYISAGGGGGSGGTLVYRGREAILSGISEAKGGRGGIGEARGGDGSPGRIRVETLAGDADCFNCDPPGVSGPISDTMLGRTVGRSDFLNTHPPAGTSVAYQFDGNEISGGLAGRVRYDAEDIVVLDARGRRAASESDLPQGSRVEIFFRGAFPDPENPNAHNPATVTPWFADISDCDGFPLLQWEVRFQVVGIVTEDASEDPETPAVDDIRIRFRFE